MFITVQHYLCLLWPVNPGGSKQEADGKVLIIPAILSHSDDMIISLRRTQPHILFSCHQNN